MPEHPLDKHSSSTPPRPAGVVHGDQCPCISHPCRRLFLKLDREQFALEGSFLLQPGQEILFHACSPLDSAEPHFQIGFHISTMLCPGELPPLLWSCSPPQPCVHGAVLQQCQATGTQDALPGHLCHRGEGLSSLLWAATAEAAVLCLFGINRET